MVSADEKEDPEFVVGVPHGARPGFCKEHGLHHAWAPGPTLLSYPGIATRYCLNCGQRQKKSLAEQPWTDG